MTQVAVWNLGGKCPFGIYPSILYPGGLENEQNQGIKESNVVPLNSCWCFSYALKQTGECNIYTINSLLCFSSDLLLSGILKSSKFCKSNVQKSWCVYLK